MSHILITFLGTGKKGNDDFYEKEKYHFDNDNTPYYEHNFFGLAVLDHLITKENKPDKLVILGTPSSMWNALFEIKGEVKEDDEDDWASLADAIEENTDSPEDEATEEEKITEYFPSLQNFLNKCLNINCELRIIPYGESQDKQIAILKKMAECVKDKDTVSLDITHGLRHLPMLVILSAMYLEVIKSVNINGIFYGAEGIKNRHDDITPALNLEGLLGIAKWYGALKSFDKDGDYGVFADLLEQDGLKTNQTKLLNEAAFFERIFNVSQAARKLTAFSNKVPEDLPGIGSLFSDTLNSCTSWAKKANVYVRQRDMAYSFLNKQDYSRAAIFAVEAFITHLMIELKTNIEDITNNKQRSKVKKRYQNKQLNRIKEKNRYDFQLLNQLRNKMAHSDDQLPKKVQEIMESENPQQELETTLKRLMKHLLPKS